MTNTPPRENMNSITKIAVEHFGTANRIDKLTGEMGELLAAFQHWRDGRDKSEEEVIDELADVYILLHQNIKIFGEDKVMEVVQKKLRHVKEVIRLQRAEVSREPSIIGQNSRKYVGEEDGC